MYFILQYLRNYYPNVNVKLYCCRRQTRHANQIEKSSTSAIASSTGEQQTSAETASSSGTTPPNKLSSSAAKPSAKAATSATGTATGSDSIDSCIASEGSSGRTMSRHRRRVRSSTTSASVDRCTALRGESFGSTDDVFPSTQQTHKENDFRQPKKITRSQMRGISLISFPFPPSSSF